MTQIRSFVWGSCVGALALVAGCLAEDDLAGDPATDPEAEVEAADGTEETAAALVTGSGDLLPSLSNRPNIGPAAAARFGTSPVVRALYRTTDGLQIYRCELNASGQPVWALRTPLAGLWPSGNTRIALPTVSNTYHARSDFGELVLDAELRAMGLLDSSGTRTNAPTWQITFAGSTSSLFTPVRREIVAGRVIAQDAITPASQDIPELLIEVRGRAISTISGGLTTATSSAPNAAAHPIAASDYLLRLFTRGGVAPAASACTTATVGRESQQYYTASYYFIDTNSGAP